LGGVAYAISRSEVCDLLSYGFDHTCSFKSWRERQLRGGIHTASEINIDVVEPHRGMTQQNL
tara:strand:- start:1065 stop:1250 length:186 start_codon:yes stop_codon:yes gene_type:complete